MRRWTWVALIVWLLIAVGATPLAGRLFDVTPDDPVSWLPRSASLRPRPYT